MVRFIITFALCLICGAMPARAVVVALSNDASYTQAPASDDFGFANVGVVNNFIAGIPATGVYLGDGWVISAYHNVSDGASGFAFTGVAFGGIGYTVDATTATRLHNPDTSLADLALFRLTSEPPLLGASLSGTTPLGASNARMMGIGQDREANETGWNVSGGVWTEVGTSGTYLGYDLIGTRAMRWGTNSIQSNALASVQIEPRFGPVQAFRLDFDRVSGEGMATPGDSGGGIFVKNGGAWQLAGVMVAAATFPGQPAGSVSYGNGDGNGNVTFAANIATYKTEIENVMATVPEPSAALLLLSSLAFLPRRRRLR